MHPQPLTSTTDDRCAPAAAQTLFPPKDADTAGYRAWLARADWPEVVFGARLPGPPTGA